MTNLGDTQRELDLVDLQADMTHSGDSGDSRSTLSAHSDLQVGKGTSMYSSHLKAPPCRIKTSIQAPPGLLGSADSSRKAHSGLSRCVGHQECHNTKIFNLILIRTKIAFSIPHMDKRMYGGGQEGNISILPSQCSAQVITALIQFKNVVNVTSNSTQFQVKLCNNVKCNTEVNGYTITITSQSQQTLDEMLQSIIAHHYSCYRPPASVPLNVYSECICCMASAIIRKSTLRIHYIIHNVYVSPDCKKNCLSALHS